MAGGPAKDHGDLAAFIVLRGGDDGVLETWASAFLIQEPGGAAEEAHPDQAAQAISRGACGEPRDPEQQHGEDGRGEPLQRLSAHMP